MQRGKELEQYIQAEIDSLSTWGIHGHKNHTQRTHSGLPIKGEPFDFEIFFPGQVHLFDAKECSSRKLRWSFSDIRLPDTRLARQFSALHQCALSGSYVQAYFLVWFKRAPNPFLFIRFDTAYIWSLLNYPAKKYLSPEEGIPWHKTLYTLSLSHSASSSTNTPITESPAT